MFSKKKLFIALLVLLIAGGGAYFLPRYLRKPLPVGNNYNIVLISIDTCRADFLGCYGNSAISTPNLDRLARNGVLFENFFSTINTTLPSHASLMTGLYPRNHGVARNAMRLSNKNITLAEYLSVKGYNTAAFIGSYALASVFGINQGFKTFDESFIGNAQDYIGRTITMTTKDGKEMETFDTNTNTGDITRPAEEVNQSFFNWLEKNKQQKFFAFVHYYDPHFPYYPPEKWYKKHLASIPADTPLTEQDRIASYQNLVDQIATIDAFQPKSMERMELPPVLHALLELYKSEIEYSDFAVGQIMNRLKQDQINDNTIVIVMSDHGENLVEHFEFNSFLRHGTLTYQTEIHVPFLISCPGLIPSGRRVKGNHSSIDVFPTLLDLTGVPSSLHFDGLSFYRELFGDDSNDKRIIFSEASQPRVKNKRDANETLWLNNGNSASAMMGDYKYMDVPWKKFEGLYQYSQDQAEINNLLRTLEQSDPKVVEQFRKELDQWRTKALVGNIDTQFELSDEEREKLESLGYVQ